MPTAAVRPSPAVGSLLRGRRKELGLTLNAVSERLSAAGERIPLSTLARIEQGKLDPGVRRLHKLLRLYDLPPHLVADVLDLEDVASAEPLPSGDLETLYRDGAESWRQGNLSKGMAYLMAIRGRVPADPEGRMLRQKATLVFAGAARDLGKFEIAEQVVRGLLREPIEPTLRVPLLVLAASIWRGLGATEAALAFVRQAETRLSHEDPTEEGWVLHQKARVLLQDGEIAEALRAVERARSAYRASRDTFDEAKLAILEVEVHEASGDIEQALWHAQGAVRFAQEHGHTRVLLHARLKLGALLVRHGQLDAGLDALRDCLAQSILLQDRQGEFLAHYFLWKAYEALNDPARARLELESSSYFVRFVQDVSPEAEEIRKRFPVGVTHAKPNDVPDPPRDR